METQTSNEEGGSKPADDEVRSLIDFMRQRDLACPLCKYNLRNLTTPVCPECGTRLALGVHQAEPFLTAWIVTMVAMSMVAGFGILLLAATVAERQWPIHGSSIVRLVWASTIVAIPLAALLIVFRRWLLRRDRKTQTALACLAVAFAAIVIGVVARS